MSNSHSVVIAIVLLFTTGRSPHPEEPQSGVSKDAAREIDTGASWFETALARLLTMRIW
jgi:hypothetical protein